MTVEHLLTAKAALVLGRPVKWTETRSENMVAMWHGRGHVHDVELGLKRDGTITGLRVFTIAEAGAYAAIGAFLPFFTQMMAANVYIVPKVEFNWQAVVTNTTPVAAYRGAGRPEAIHMMERVLDIAADELGIDPVEIRRKNFIPPEAFPYMPNTGLGATYDTGEYDKALDAVLEHAGYDALRAEQKARRDRGDRMLMGIGLASYLEISAPMVLTREFGAVEIEDDGTVTARVGTSAHGQGHETAFSQIIADTLGVPFENVRVLHSDTDEVPRGGGTGGSRSGQIGGSALLVASQRCSRRRSGSRRTCSRRTPTTSWSATAGSRSRACPRAAWRGPTSRPRRRIRRSGRKVSPSGCSTSSTSNRMDRRSRSARTCRSSRSTPTPGASSSCATSPSTTAARSSTR